MENRALSNALKLYEQEDFDHAFQLFIELANNGEVEAQAFVGLMYSLGHGVKRDVKCAIRWLTKAATNGSGQAAHNLATLYLTCEPDIPIDKGKGREWYKKAQSLGFVVTDKNWYDKL